MTELDQNVAALLDGRNIAHIATVMPDGGPHTVPVWVGREDGLITVLTGPASRKARNLAVDPRAALSITDANQPYSSAVIRGRVVRTLDDHRAWQIIDRLAQKYTGHPYGVRTGRVVLLIEPQHAKAMTFG